MEEKVDSLDYLLVPAGLLVLGIYHVWLFITVLRNPIRTVIGLNAHTRQQWVFSMMTKSEGVTMPLLLETWFWSLKGCHNRLNLSSGKLSSNLHIQHQIDPQTGVESKDAVISEETGLSARLYVPKAKITQNPAKLPLLVYYHGGGFCMGSPFCAYYNSYVASLVAETNVIAVSVAYRKAPENPLPIGFEDSWAALQWVGSHFEGKGPEEWLNSYADFGRVFLGGDSAGANIAHHMALKIGYEGLVGVKLNGIVLVHPYFWGSEPIEGESTVVEDRGKAEGIWRFACPTTCGADDPLINPGKDRSILRSARISNSLMHIREKRSGR